MASNLKLGKLFTFPNVQKFLLYIYLKGLLGGLNETDHVITASNCYEVQS